MFGFVNVQHCLRRHLRRSSRHHTAQAHSTAPISAKVTVSRWKNGRETAGRYDFCRFPGFGRCMTSVVSATYAMMRFLLSQSSRLLNLREQPGRRRRRQRTHSVGECKEDRDSKISVLSLLAPRSLLTLHLYAPVSPVSLLDVGSCAAKLVSEFGGHPNRRREKGRFMERENPSGVLHRFRGPASFSAFFRCASSC